MAEWRPIALSDKRSPSADPGFVNREAGDYHLASKLSPVVNAGTTEVYESRFLPFDFDGWSTPISDTRFAGATLYGGLWYLPPPYPECGFDVYRVGDAAAPWQSPYYCGSQTVCS